MNAATDSTIETPKGVTLETPPCPDCGGAMGRVGSSETRLPSVAGMRISADSLRCDDMEGCDGGLEIVISPPVHAGALFTPEGALVCQSASFR